MQGDLMIYYSQSLQVMIGNTKLISLDRKKSHFIVQNLFSHYFTTSNQRLQVFLANANFIIATKLLASSQADWQESSMDQL